MSWAPTLFGIGLGVVTLVSRHENQKRRDPQTRPAPKLGDGVPDGNLRQL